MRKLFLICFIVLALFIAESKGDGAIIIKVKGTYGILDKGLNQGIAEGQILYVKRLSASGLIEVGTVKVIRATANRAAVKQISNTNSPFLQKGDKLYTSTDNKIQPTSKQQPRDMNTRLASSNQPSVSMNKQAKVVKSYKGRRSIPLPEPGNYYTTQSGLKNPWVGIDLGTMVPLGALTSAYSPSLRFGISYMVSAGRDLTLGIEINNSFVKSAAITNSTFNGQGNTSTSILEGLFVVQKFIGNRVFIEGGGGIYRPQIRTISADDVKTTFSSTKIGFFGGTGFFVPTSEYAGFLLKGRLHNYFDGRSRQYFGLTGGFRFKLSGY